MCGEHSLCSGHTGFAPAHRWVLSPVYTAQAPRLLYMEQALRCVQFQFSGIPQKPDSVGPAFCAFPGLSSSGSQELDGRTLPGAVRLIPSKVPASVSARARVRWPVRCMQLVSVLRSWPLAATLPADVDHPECEEVFA